MKFKLGKPTPRNVQEQIDADIIDAAARNVVIEIVPQDDGYWGWRFTFNGTSWKNVYGLASESKAEESARSVLKEKVTLAKHKSLKPRTIEVDISKW